MRLKIGIFSIALLAGIALMLSGRSDDSDESAELALPSRQDTNLRKVTVTPKTASPPREETHSKRENVDSPATEPKRRASMSKRARPAKRPRPIRLSSKKAAPAAQGALAVSRSPEEERAWEQVKTRLFDALDKERAETAIQLFDDNCAQAAFLGPRPKRRSDETNDEFAARLVQHSNTTESATKFRELRSLIPEPEIRETLITPEFMRDYFGSCPNRDRL